MNKLAITLASVSLCLTSLAGFAKNQPLPVPKAVPVTQPIVMHAVVSVPQEASQTSANTPATAIGSSSYLFNPKTRVLKFFISYAGLSSAPFMAHFHDGAATTNGPIIQTICGKPAPTLIGACPDSNSGVLAGEWTVPAQDVPALLQGKIYVNLHTTLNKDGEIRGQLLP